MSDELKEGGGKDYLLSLVPMLKAAGVVRLAVNYDGSGDEGQIQEITVYGSDNVEIKLDLDREKLDQAACDVLHSQGVDWYNNEGGFGDVVLNVHSGRVTIDHNERFESSSHREYKV